MARTLAVLFAIAALTVPTLAFAQGGGGMGRGMHRGPHGGPNAERFVERAKDAGVNSATLIKIEAAFAANKKQMEALRQEADEARDELHQLMSSEKPDKTIVLQQAELVGHIQTELRKLRLGTMLDVRALLTAEQWKKIGPAGRMGKGRKGRGMGRGRGGMGRGQRR